MSPGQAHIAPVAPGGPLAQPVTTLPGLGAKRAGQLAKLGIGCVGDFLTHFPRTYEDRRQVRSILSCMDGERVCVLGTVAAPPVTTRVRQGLSLTKARIFDNSGMMQLTYFNSPFVKDKLVQGAQLIFYGTVEARGGMKSMVNPVFEAPGQGVVLGRIVPIYPLSQGLNQRLMMQGAQRALALAQGRWREPLPGHILEAHHLCDQATAYTQMHRPDSYEALERAQRRLVFEELFVYGCASRALRQQDAAAPGLTLQVPRAEDFYAALPFQPTGAQRRAVEEIYADMAGPRRMNRLLQGDVGSGKTLVAAASVYMAAKGGAQSAIMAPTELLAQQHAKTLTALLQPHGITVGLLTASLKASEKRAVKEALAQGQLDVLCGTHALLQGDVAFSRPGLVVVDEQHRFGVRQRAVLRDKAPEAHLLVMSATPIPRTLTLIIYGDLSISVLDELPPGRTPVQTFADSEARRPRILRFLQKQIDEGGQAYVVCPLIEEEDGPGERATVAQYAQRLAKTLPGLRIGQMHGKLKAGEKQAVMAAFLAHQLDVLVSTTVVEVGVDVPNANLMLVENADLFGLSQLHQLRGRVGRGARQSYCILMSQAPGPVARQRLETLCREQDGFKIAEEDLRLRGPGDFLGEKQSGMPEFRLSGRISDPQLPAEAMAAAAQLVEQDSTLSRYPLLAARVQAILAGNTNN